jgi:hypothetical protein
MKPKEQIQVLTNSSTFLPVTVHTAKPTNRDLISYQDICAMHIAVNKRGKIGEILQGAT